MKLLLLGEGASDLGAPDEADLVGFRKGAMTCVLDALLGRHGLDGEYKLLTRGDVSQGIKSSKRSISSRPKEVDKELCTIYKSAFFMGQKVGVCGQDGAVYFHDADRTCSTPSGKAQRVEAAINVGFAAADCATGVPMVPNPRSEAWLLAYFQKNLPRQTMYNRAERFEELPGNDKSPHSAKKLLAKALGCAESDIYGIVMEQIDEIDWTRVSMPSFDRFKCRFEKLIDEFKKASCEQGE